jgi:hypothetical protein
MKIHFTNQHHLQFSLTTQEKMIESNKIFENLPPDEPTT